MKTVYDFNVKDAYLNEVSLGEYHDKVLLVVNVASQCGLTPQYKGLQELYEKYNSNGLEILGFPCNQFKGQEPGTNEEIQFFFDDATKKMDKGGYIVVQFIEKDLLVEKSNPEDEINFNLFHNAKSELIFDEYNPIRFLSAKNIINAAKAANFELIASKRLIQSYDLHEEKFRLDRYLAFKVNNNHVY